MPTIDWLAGIEGVVVLLIATLVVTVASLVGSLRRFRWADLQHVLSDEGGAAYTLAYVLTVPIYILAINLIVQGTLILLVKMGTVYSAYAAARSAIVWVSTAPDRAQEKARLAAVHALVPFADSQRRRDTSGGPDCEEFLSAYRKYAQQTHVQDAYLRAKYNFAARTVVLRPLAVDTSRHNGDVTATVVYEMPLRVPVVNRLLGTSSPHGPVCAIESTITLPNEGARDQAPDWLLKGVRYDPN